QHRHDDRHAEPALLARARQRGGHRRCEAGDRAVLLIGLPEDIGAAEFAGFVTGVRDDLRRLGAPGGLTVLAAPTALAGGVDRWGPSGALPLMRRVKERFDPGRRMSPGRFAGGI
ncbi:hypothetical protein AB0C32_44970, partial [Streptosporangium sp. NPDC048865]